MSSLFQTKPRVDSILVGIDLGSRYTKVAYRNLDDARNSVTALNIAGKGCIVLSSTWLSQDGTAFFANNLGREFSDLKTSFLKKAGVVANTPSASNGAIELGTTLRWAAVFYFQNLFKDILKSLQNQVEQSLTFEQIYFNVCVPVASTKSEDEKLIRLYQGILEPAFNLASDQSINKGATKEPLDRACCEYDANGQHSGHIRCTPEPVAQIIPYVRLQGRKPGKHAIIDIGGATVDFSIFDFSGNFKEMKLYSMFVHVGGMNVIEQKISEMRKYSKREEIINLLFGDSWKKNPLSHEEMRVITDFFANVFKKSKVCWEGAYQKDPDDEKWSGKSVRILLSGGGAYDGSAYFQEVSNIFREPYWKTNMPEGTLYEKHDLMHYNKLQQFNTKYCGDSGKEIYRMLVAYGLCFTKEEYPDSLRPYAVTPARRDRREHIMDDPWREPYYE